MRIMLTYSSKTALRREYCRRYPECVQVPEDCLAEGDTPETIAAVRDAIASLGYEVTAVEADAGLEAELMRFAPELVFNLAEGLFGESRESYVPMLCEKLFISCTGSGSLATAICLHKGRCKEVLTANGIANPPFRIIHPGETFPADHLHFPAIVKPLAEGSSKGIFNSSVADSPEAAAKLVRKCLSEYSEPAIVEEFLPGAEFTAGVIGNGDDLEILPLVGMDFNQLPPGAKKIYSYEAKWIWDKPEKPLRIFQCPAAISADLHRSIETLIRRTFRALELRDWCRMDIRLDAAGVPNIIEVNPIPGILPDPADNSCFPKAARSAGYEYREIFRKVIHAALKRERKA